MRTQGKRDSPGRFMGIDYCEGVGKQKRKTGRDRTVEGIKEYMCVWGVSRTG